MKDKMQRPWTIVASCVLSFLFGIVIFASCCAMHNGCGIVLGLLVMPFSALAFLGRQWAAVSLVLIEGLGGLLSISVSWIVTCCLFSPLFLLLTRSSRKWYAQINADLPLSEAYCHSDILLHDLLADQGQDLDTGTLVRVLVNEMLAIGKGYYAVPKQFLLENGELDFAFRFRCLAIDDDEFVLTYATPEQIIRIDDEDGFVAKEETWWSIAKMVVDDSRFAGLIIADGREKRLLFRNAELKIALELFDKEWKILKKDDDCGIDWQEKFCVGEGDMQITTKGALLVGHAPVIEIKEICRELEKAGIPCQCETLQDGAHLVGSYTTWGFGSVMRIFVSPADFGRAKPIADRIICRK